LAQKGIKTVEDLLSFFPYKYLDRRQLDPIGDLRTGQRTGTGQRTVIGRIVSSGIVLFRNRRRLFEILLADQTGAVSLKWFHFYPREMQARFQKKAVLMVSGEISFYRGEPQFVHPEVQVVDEELMEEVRAPGIIPVYSQIPGLGQRTIRKIVRNGLDRNGLDRTGLDLFHFEEILPSEILQRHHLPSKAEALREIHFPPPERELASLNNFRSPGHLREIFEELFFVELGIAFKRQTTWREEGISFSWTPEEMKGSIATLPFRLTTAQRRALHEILVDMKTPHPMGRLIQGDVGSGKTVVALLAAIVAIRNGYQAALMAPTEILAEQHYRTATQLLKPFNLTIGLLTGSLPAPLKTKRQSGIRRGIYSLVIGTHALISEGVEFQKLGLAIIDEQHRFGVLQRAALKTKGNPDLLVMTATPIPRTLAMTLYGDLDLSVIDEMPPGRRPIRTEVVESKNRSYLHARISEVIGRGEQVYMIYPLVEESEKLALRQGSGQALKDATRMHAELTKVFPRWRISLLHGKVPSEEKEEVMGRFKRGEVEILVATTVIEVGIDIPNATLIVIEHADRFGLSQLHQLRGRVGRGDKPSRCLLVSDYRKTEEAYRRLEVMTETQDGFRIAEEDLKIRGAGELMGTRQAGLPEFRVANLLRDQEILRLARGEAFRLVESDPLLSFHPALRNELQRKWGERMTLAEVG